MNNKEFIVIILLKNNGNFGVFLDIDEFVYKI